jgi:hypothetical protein
MITRADAEEIAAGWARGESERRGYECAPMISEFDLGFVVWTRQPPSIRPIPGDGGRAVIDRATGELTTWPGVPADVVAELYRDHQPAERIPDDGPGSGRGDAGPRRGTTHRVARPRPAADDSDQSKSSPRKPLRRLLW